LAKGGQELGKKMFEEQIGIIRGENEEIFDTSK
jgi:hypothetical protein